MSFLLCGNSVGVEDIVSRNDKTRVAAGVVCYPATSGNRLWPSILLMIVPCSASTTKTYPSPNPTASHGFPGATDGE